MKLNVPSFLATTNASIQIANGTDENGSKNIVDSFDVMCRHEQSNAVVYTKEGTKVTLKAKAFIFDKVGSFPDDTSGFCSINSVKYDIVSTRKLQNPDGSINHIVLELI